MGRLLTALFGLILICGSSHNANAEQAAQPLVQESAKVGDIAPAFDLKDQKGVSRKLSDYAGKVVVLEWTNPECPFVKRHYKKGTMKNLEAKYKSQGVVWLSISSTYHLIGKHLKDWAEQQGMEYPILDDQLGNVGRAYGAQTTPHMFIINKEGKLAYMGAIDNDPYGDEAQPRSFFEEALISIIGGQQPLVGETTPYGCSVKYEQ